MSQYGFTLHGRNEFQRQRDGRGAVDFPTSWREARDLFAAHSRHGGGRVRLAHNTYLEDRGCDVYAVMLHGTAVVRFHSSGWTKLHSAGWQTVTTRDRWRRCRLRVYTAGGIAGLTLSDGSEVAYRDGMRVRGSRVSGGGPPAEDCRRVRRRRLRAGAAEPLPPRSSSLRIQGGNAPEAFLTSSTVRIILSGPRRVTRQSDAGGGA